MGWKIRKKWGRSGLLRGWMGERGSRAKLENLIPIDDIEARGLWESSVHFRLPVRHVEPHSDLIQDSDVLIGKGCGILQISPSSSGLHFLALQSGAAPATWRHGW